jgi:hypothetical protein
VPLERQTFLLVAEHLPSFSFSLINHINIFSSCFLVGTAHSAAGKVVLSYAG